MKDNSFFCDQFTKMSIMSENNGFAPKNEQVPEKERIQTDFVVKLTIGFWILLQGYV